VTTAVLGHWPILDKLLRDAEAEIQGVRDSTRIQANVLYRLGNPDGGYWHLGPEHQTDVIHRLMALVPRIGNNTEPRRMAELLLCLYETHEPLETLSRAVKVEEFPPRQRFGEEHLFPTSGLIGLFLDWAGLASCSMAYLFWSAVALIGSSCRYNFFIDRHTDTMRMNWFIIMVGEKGTFKSTGLDAAREVWGHLNCQVHGWKPGTALPNFHDLNPYQVRFLPEDSNQATLVKALATQSIVYKGKSVKPEEAAVMALDELQTLFGREGWQIEKLVPWLNRIFADKPYVYQTGKGGLITIQHPAVTLLGCCPPEIMRASITPALFAGGFLDRCVIVSRADKVGAADMYPTPMPRDPLVAAQLARALKQLTMRSHREEIIATSEATEWFKKEWFPNQPEPTDDRDYSLPRKANHLWKLAAILCISDGSLPEIHPHHFQLAAKLLDSERRHFRELLGFMDEPVEGEQMRWIEDLLFRSGAVEPSYMLRSKLFSLLRSRKGLSPPTLRAKPFLEDLEVMGRVKHLVRVGKPPHTGEAYQLTTEAAEDIKLRIPSGLRASPGRRLQLVRHPDATVSPEPEADPQAQEPDSGQEPA